MIEDIKRLAQFLFDNAGEISNELIKADKYRALTMQIGHFNLNGVVSTKIDASIYDQRSTTHPLANISIEEFASCCDRMNRESGVTPVPEETKVRRKL